MRGQLLGQGTAMHIDEGDYLAMIEEEAECDYCGQEGHVFRSCPRRNDYGPEDY